MEISFCGNQVEKEMDGVIKELESLLKFGE
jgi:hypothetical protein